MASRINPRFSVVKYSVHDGGVFQETRGDRVAGEEPLEIRVGGTALTTTMRTPGDDLELVHGLLRSEGIINSSADVAEARYCQGIGPDGMNTYNVIDVELQGHQPLRPEFIRNVVTTSACGVCGSTSIQQVLGKNRPAITPVHPSPEFIMSLPAALQTHQKAFRRTGGIHAAGAFTLTGEPIVIREDIGRHNAADKVIGYLSQQGHLPAHECLLVMSSRASFELVQKAITAGFSGLVAVSAASSLAIELAREANFLLTGFTRTDRVNVYSGALS